MTARMWMQTAMGSVTTAAGMRTGIIVWTQTATALTAPAITKTAGMPEPGTAEDTAIRWL